MYISILETLQVFPSFAPKVSTYRDPRHASNSPSLSGNGSSLPHCAKAVAACRDPGDPWLNTMYHCVSPPTIPT